MMIIRFLDTAKVYLELDFVREVMRVNTECTVHIYDTPFVYKPLDLWQAASVYIARVNDCIFSVRASPFSAKLFRYITKLSKPLADISNFEGPFWISF
jgi:hypothetical protein